MQWRQSYRAYKARLEERIGEVDMSILCMHIEGGSCQRLLFCVRRPRASLTMNQVEEIPFVKDIDEDIENWSKGFMRRSIGSLSHDPV